MPAKLIAEPIEVIADFDNKGIHPLRFKWQDKVDYACQLKKLPVRSLAASPNLGLSCKIGASMRLINATPINHQVIAPNLLRLLR